MPHAAGGPTDLTIRTLAAPKLAPNDIIIASLNIAFNKALIEPEQ